MAEGERSGQPDTTRRAELERLAIAAIREHRELIAAAEAADEALHPGEGEPDLSPECRASLEEVCLKRRLRMSVQQHVLNNLINQLGFIPDVPSNGADGS